MASTRWRVYITSGKNGYTMIGDIEMRATVGGADQCTGGSVSASAYDNGDPEGDAFDGNPSTNWTIQASRYPAWIEYTFASAVDVAQLAIIAGTTYNPIGLYLAYYDGANWITVLTANDGTGWSSSVHKTFDVPVPPHYTVVASGGAVAGGVATIGYHSIKYTVVGSGGAVAGGVATIAFHNLKYTLLASGGAVVGGAATITHLNTGDFVVLLETLTCRDTATIPATGKLAADTLTFTEAQAVEYGKLVHDYLFLNQTITANWTGTHSLTESITALDTVTGARAYLLAIAEVASIPDAALRTLGFVTSDWMTTRDAALPIGKHTHSLAESFILYSTLSGGRGFKDTLLESLTATDLLAVLVNRMCIAAETLTASDTVTPLRTAPITQSDSITITETLSPTGKFNHLLTELLRFNITITLNGETYQCWAFSRDSMLASLYTNYPFNSYASLDGHDYGCKSTGIFILEGDDDAGTTIERGVKFNFAAMGTHLQKRLTHAYFGIVGENPVLKVKTDSGEHVYYVIGQRQDIGRALKGVNWELTLTQIDSMDFIEVSPVILSR